MTHRFGNFVLDGDTRQLLSGAEEIHLSTKAFELLTVLVANRRRVVSKAELLERLWPSTFVEETNLAGLVAEIRRALQDVATRPEYVRTVYRVGYRFVGEVTEVTEDPGASRPRPAVVRPCLVFEGRRILLMEGANVIGREPDATIQRDSPGVSRHHARILISQGQATVEDLGSKNGTFVNGERITTARLSDGDEIRLGAVTLTFHLAPPAGSTETVAPDQGTR